MTAVAAYGRATRAIFMRDLLIFLSYRGRLPGQLIGVAATVTLFYYVSRLVKTPEFPTPQDYFAFALVGIVVVRALALSFGGLVGTVRQELVAGTFERMATSPLGPIFGTAAMTLFPLTLSLFLGMATIGFAVVAFDVSLEWTTVPLALPVALLAAMTLVPFSLMITAAVVAFKQAGAAVRLFTVIITVVSGFLFPVSLLPGWIRWASDVQPFTPLIELLRHLLIGTPLQDPVTITLIKVLAFVAVLLPLALYLLHSAIEWGRRRATLTEY